VDILKSISLKFRATVRWQSLKRRVTSQNSGF